MNHVYVCLVSDQTIPNIIMAIHYGPDVLWFISTEKMKENGKTECIKNTLQLKGLLPPSIDIEEVIVNQDSFADCTSKIEALVEKIEKAAGDVEYLVNITGGNKVMALAAYEIFREIGQKVTINYMPIGKNDFVQFFPRKKPLKVCEVKERLTLEEYLSGYGFRIQNKDRFSAVKNRVLSNKDATKWILDNYEQLKDMLGFMYKHLEKKRAFKNHPFCQLFDRNLSKIENEMLDKYNFEIRDGLISKDLIKDEIVYLTGGWFEEYVFNEVYSLVQENILNDAMIGVKIKRLSGTENELDIAFVKDNVFYHIECKTLGNKKNQDIIRDEVYKRGAILSQLGLGEERAIICTTHDQINESKYRRAMDYGVNLLTIKQVRDLKNRLRERFGAKNE
ncbi:MAG: hypothetical protein AUK23_12400 [Deltaproteobacteria bacterium CG2_30_43_15]|nr:MAG: hypothetical protein AUK23_12400 [Deltaproteobacteria bacterium CG2_30_43_15]